MLNKITKGTDINNQVKEFVKEADRMVNLYGWGDRSTFPYRFAVPVVDTINELREFDKYTKASQAYLVSLANGFADVLNAWEKNAKEQQLERVYCLNKDGHQLGNYTKSEAESVLETIKNMDESLAEQIKIERINK